MWIVVRAALAACAAALVSCASALAADRVALVIGNGAYEFANALPNPTNDAADIGEKLKTLGFEVHGGNDLDLAGMRAAIRQFAENSPVKVVLFFYAGHGMEVDGRNYLIPIDAKLESATSIEFEVVDANVVLKFMTGEKRIAVALLDACRDNPLARGFKKKSRSNVGTGLGDVKVDQVGGGGLLYGLATAPGDVAADGEGRNSPFTKALLKHIGTPGVEFEQMMKSVKRDVDADTKGDQRPYLTSSLIDDLYLAPDARPLGDKRPLAWTEVAPGPPRKPADELWWEQIEGTKNAEAYEQFIKNFPGSEHVGDAKGRIALLQSLVPKEEPKKDDVPAIVAGVCPPETIRRLAMVTQLKQRGHLGLGFPTLDLTQGRIGCDAPDMVAAIRQYQVSIGCPATGGLDEEQLGFLEGRTATQPSCGIPDAADGGGATPPDPPAADEEAAHEAAEAAWNFGGRDWITVYNQLAGYLSYRGIDRDAGTVTRDDIRTIQSQAGMAATGYLTPELYDYVAGQPKRLKPRDLGRGVFTAFEDWTSHRIEGAEPYCFVKTDALSNEGQFGQGEAAYLYFAYNPAWNNADLLIRFGENVWFDAAEKVHLIANGQRTELFMNQDGFLWPERDQSQNLISTRAFLTLRDATDVVVSGASALGGPLDIYYSARGFAAAFDDMNRNCSNGLLGAWLQ